MSDYGAAIFKGNSPKSDVELEKAPSLCSSDASAEAHELRVQAELNAQYLELRRQARGVFDALKGRIGANSEKSLEEAFEKAAADYTSGQFLMQRLGADRHFDIQLVATLTQLRNGILNDIEAPTAIDHMLADTALAAYRNFIRVQGWLGSASLEFERGMFGHRRPEEVLGTAEVEEASRVLEKIEHSLLPLLERSQRMLIRALDRIDRRRVRRSMPDISIGIAGQVNVNGRV